MDRLTESTLSTVIVTDLPSKGGLDILPLRTSFRAGCDRFFKRTGGRIRFPVRPTRKVPSFKSVDTTISLTLFERFSLVSSNMETMRTRGVSWLCLTPDSFLLPILVPEVGSSEVVAILRPLRTGGSVVRVMMEPTIACRAMKIDRLTLVCETGWPILVIAIGCSAVLEVSYPQVSGTTPWSRDKAGEETVVRSTTLIEVVTG